MVFLSGTAHAGGYPTPICDVTAVFGSSAHGRAYRKPICGSWQNIKHRLIIDLKKNQ